MKTIIARFYGLVLAAGLFYLLLALPGCSVERFAPAVDAQVDSTLCAAGLPPLAFGKAVFRGPVTLQMGQGNTNTTTGPSKVKTRAQALSTGDNSPVTASQKKGALPWWVFALVGVGAIIGWEYLSHQLSPLGWLPWRTALKT